MTLQVLHQHARVIEPHRLVVEQPAPELNRVIELQPGGLIGRARESSSVRTAEPIHRETLHGGEQHVGNLARHLVGEAPIDEVTL